MTPEVILISKTEVDWSTLRKNIFVATNLTPSSLIAQCPVTFSPAAEYLIFAAYLKYDFIIKDPLQILRTMPRDILAFLQYSFLVACDKETLDTLRDMVNIVWCINKVENNKYCVLGTGPLFDWWYYIILYLSSVVTYEKNYRVLFDKLLILLEQEGLGELFYEYRKKSLLDKTFLLERK